jgi:hypothetical protein
LLIEEYFAEIENDIISCPFVHSHNLIKDKRSVYIGLIEGVIKFLDNSTLHFIEFVDVGKKIEKYKYSYHYEDNIRSLIFRYDIAPHYRNIETFPYHKHESENKVVASKEPSLKEVLFEIEKLILK